MTAPLRLPVETLLRDLDTALAELAVARLNAEGCAGELMLAKAEAFRLRADLAAALAELERLKAEPYREVVDALDAARADLADLRARIEALHHEALGRPVCLHCQKWWPCPTAAALTEPTGGQP